jgi:ATP-dependent DNA ligase
MINFNDTSWIPKHRSVSSAVPRRREDEPFYPPQQAVVIRGANAAPELCMLATDPTCEQERLFNYGANWKWICQQKVDGIRALWIDGRIVSREGTPLDMALHCQPGLKRLQAAFGQPMMFDGEYVEDDGFSATLAAHRRGKGTGIFWIFDAVPLADWWNDTACLPIEARLNHLRQVHGQADSPFVGILIGETLGGGEIDARAKSFFDMGLEGLVLKRPGSLYRRHRSPDWLKLKQTLTGRFPVVDVLRKAGNVVAIMARTDHGPVRLVLGSRHDKRNASGFATMSYQLSSGSRRIIRSAKLLSVTATAFEEGTRS